MFREMRRKNQALSPGECSQILARRTSGVLAVLGDGGRPYAVPLSYVWDGEKIFFHCAQSGHKLDALRSSPPVCFCVVDEDTVVPEKYTTLYRSVTVFGRAEEVTDGAEKLAALLKIAEKYSPGDEAGCQKEAENALKRVCIIEFTPEHITGKQSIELARRAAAAENAK
jgi:nitroimidazol reductase NimA-like FMN-containing flavoprotein (pyridoxamine 5'-phosphate oxidase superfamily)